MAISDRTKRYLTAGLSHDIALSDAQTAITTTDPNRLSRLHIIPE